MSKPCRSTADKPHFCGSYRPKDVRFLLKPIKVQPTGVAEKERLIQSGRRHYSEMLSRESLPSPKYMEVFHHAFAMSRTRMAEGLLDLAAIITARRPDEITLVSLARAGTPIGVMLKHILVECFERETQHYSISIIRDRGIDQNAIRFILDEAGRDPAGLLFVDGWTGKGVIARELSAAVADFEQHHGVRLDASLFTLADLAGVGIAPSDEDYLIPSSILNATMSGLISRSVLNEQIGPDDFHGCVLYEEFAAKDLSTWFVDTLLDDARARIQAGYRPSAVPVDPSQAHARSTNLIAAIKDRFGISDVNLIKPGIGEATRVLLRRVPELLLIRDPHLPEVAHLRQLAQEKSVRCEVDPTLPYQAISLIRGLPDA
ncbi:cysteine protease StiP family protein [Thiorhodococcus mannitoliphagus]|uniref:Cysteine protease StiP family protein n=1 Tax=Thiorhodococcus mannitoliphagus TaxID=329406 RepID=A0A6P1DZ92_9GAMM|nr:cysteine protease StiP family protein [Thiorhodococcus mannitoliphagus]NEX21034.1 cysteine protease StiP family protein [Thiorhodococcus mannitoliphagus]